jgi:hypothetical protein
MSARWGPPGWRSLPPWAPWTFGRTGRRVPHRQPRSLFPRLSSDLRSGWRLCTAFPGMWTRGFCFTGKICWPPWDFRIARPPGRILTVATGRLSAEKRRTEGKTYGISLGPRGWTELLTAVWQNGGDPLKPSEPGYFEAMMYYRSFFQEGLTPTKEGADVDIYHAFRTGYLPMFISGPWMVELVGKELPGIGRKMGRGDASGKKDTHLFCGRVQLGPL